MQPPGGYGTIHPVPRVIDGSKIDEAELEKTVLVTEFETQTSTCHRFCKLHVSRLTIEIPEDR